MSKHTKGPWQYGSEYRLEDYDFCVYGQMKDCGAIPVVSDICESEESEANARLIAAAPLMYELLAMKSASGDDDCRRLLAEIGDV